MRFLVMGCNGMAGHTVSLYLKEQGYDVTGFARTKSDLVNTIAGDATDVDVIRNVIVYGRYDYVINAIGILNNEAEENKAEAVLINAYLPHLLADITQDTSTKIVHLSTDCVFSGKRGNYKDSDLRDGETFYDRSKALGELEDNRNITIRTSIIGPDRNEGGIGLLNWFMKQTGTIKGYRKAIWTGLTTLQLAKVIESICQNNLSGLYNIVPDSCISKYQLLSLFNRVLKNNKILIEPDDTVVLDKTLVPSKRIKEVITIPGYDEMVEDMDKWISGKNYLYPKYYSL